MNFLFTGFDQDLEVKQPKSHQMLPSFRIVEQNHQFYIPTRREGGILQSPCPSVDTFVTDISASTGRNDLIFGFGVVTCTVSPLSRFTAHLLPVYRATCK